MLESLLPGTGYDVHISKMKLRGDESQNVKPRPSGQPMYRPDILSSRRHPITAALRSSISRLQRFGRGMAEQDQSKSLQR